MRLLRVALLAAFIFGALPFAGDSRFVPIATAGDQYSQKTGVNGNLSLSPYWGVGIRQWTPEIEKEALATGLDPDFIASVILAESNGNNGLVSRVGAVGLMGVMPTGPGLEWRPSTEALMEPEVNVNWGVAILTEIIRQSGGDIVAALAAYSGGWDKVNSRVPREYASQVLDSYGRAVATRSGISPSIAEEWTVAAEIARGHVPVEPLILSDRPQSGLQKFGEHVIYSYTDESGKAYFVKGFAVPLAIIVPDEEDADSLASDSVNAKLLARLGLVETKVDPLNPRIVTACLPSLSRLRGTLATRWFAPSACPAWHR